ncbi:hypothetical protein WJX81_006355 [Elliptochloris bilobata]|uniref:Alpha-N-acetylglucosaminidase n=1 Tax=Elliptochloris bilobata TaxID=381761 RepID=A0AAW1RTA7_9CHLO
MWRPMVEAVEGLIARLLPRHVDAFLLHLGSRCREGHAACFEVTNESGKIAISGTTGVELASGLHAFLKERCNSSVAWQATGGNQIDTSCLEPPARAAAAAARPLYRGRSVPYHYYQNAVTPSYSMTWWSWERWEAEIDWMALHGINLPMAFTGQEAVWQRVWAQFGLTNEDLEGFFSGPAFLAWQRMGNLRGWGGPLRQSFIDGQAALQRKILQRMRSFGMTPVLPAFAGYVPEALAKRQPGAHIEPAGNWGGFTDAFCCVRLLNPLDPLFTAVGSAFVKEVRAEYGDDDNNFYAADTFNEMDPGTNDPAYLRNASSAVYNAMAAGDAGARWIMQAWLFYNEKDFWQKPQIQALISGVPTGALVMLDLYAEVQPQWARTEGFYGAPFIWCMLHNFGGNLEMYGAFEEVAAGPARALRSGADMIGIGLCPEGIEQNPAAYALMNEWAFRSEPVELRPWVERYARRRYGPATPPSAGEAWQLLLESVYNSTDLHNDHNCDVPTSRPALERAEGVPWGLIPQLWYDDSKVLRAWAALLAAAPAVGELETFRYDLVDVARQALSKRATAMWRDLAAAYDAGDLGGVSAAGGRLLELLDDMEELLASNRGFLLGPWVAAARALASSEEEAAQNEWNLRTQITVWGTSDEGGSSIEDYANKQWSGLMGSFYGERWALFVARLEVNLRSGAAYDPQAWRLECLNFTLGWTRGTQRFPLDPRGDSVAVSQRLFAKYKDEPALGGPPLV